MTKLDQFESVFRSADKAVYTYDRPTFDRVLVVTDLNEADTADITSRVRSFLTAIDRAGTRWDTLSGDAFGSVQALLESIEDRKPDLIVTYRNIGDIDLWGADFSFSLFLNNGFTVNGSYSHVSNDWFQVTGYDPLALNAPKDKGTIGVAYRDASGTFNAETVVRFAAQFPAESAGYVGTSCIEGHAGGLFEEDCVEQATLVDLSVGYKVPNTAATLQLAVTNLLNTEYRSFVGVPNIGRFALVRVKYDLF